MTTTAKLEALLDRKYYQAPLPHSNKVLATWYCLTVSEDIQRAMFTKMGSEISNSRIVLYVDRYKYSMRYALNRINNENTDCTWTMVPRKTIPKLYIKASSLMFAGIDYALASQICASLHAGTAVATNNANTWHILPDESHHDKAYSALELLSVAKPLTVDYATLLFHWIRNSSSAPNAVEEIANSTIVKDKLVLYEYQQDLVINLVQHIPQPPYLIPASWTFSWGGRKETTLLLNSLSIRCFYHIVAVHFGAGIHKLRGGGDSSLLLVLSREQLINDIELMSSLERRKIIQFVNFLTFGKGTETPDPALQPVIPMGSNMVAIPCIHLLSSNQERNLLSLMARTQTEKFDAQSHLFEKDMIAAISSLPRPANVELHSNVHLRIGTHIEELDVLLIDQNNKRLMICELRWLLGPGDPREVQNKKKECIKKVAQLRRKVERISSQDGIKAVANLSPQSESESIEGWIISGVVLISGFSGTRSTDPQYPIIPMTIFERALTSALSLESIAVWCTGLSWLPKEGIHFNLSEMRVPLDDKNFLIIDGADSSYSTRDYLSDAVAELTPEVSA